MKTFLFATLLVAVTARAELVYSPTAVWDDGTATITWTAPTHYVTEELITVPVTYRIEQAPDTSGPWTLTTTTSDLKYIVLDLSVGTYYWRIYAVAGGVDSLPVVVNKTIVEPIVTTRELCMVEGSSTGLRPVYQPSASGSRGAKVGDLAVGPTSQTAGTQNPFSRVPCSCTDLVTWSGVVYSRIPTGYVSGCRTLGMQ